MTTISSTSRRPRSLVGRTRRRVTGLAGIAIAVLMIPGCAREVTEEGALATQVCNQVDALARSRAGAESIAEPVIMASYEAYHRGLDEELFERELMRRCGPAIRAAASTLEAQHRQDMAGGEEGSSLAGNLVVHFDSCEDDGATGTVTNTTTNRITQAWVSVVFRSEGGEVIGYDLPGFSIGVGAEVPPLGPGETAVWAHPLTESQRSSYGEHDPRSVVECDVGEIYVEAWE